MSTRTFSETTMAMTAHLPPAKRGPGFRTVSVSSYSSSSASSDESVEIPEDLNSYQFLVFAGFTDETARIIYNRWLNWDNATIGSYVYDFAVGHVDGRSSVLDAVEEDDDWDTALLEMGVNDRLRAAILNPEFDSVRLTESASYWVKDTIKEAYVFVDTLTRRMEARRAVQLSRTNTPDESIQPRRAIQQRPNITSSRGASQPISAVGESATPPSAIDGRTMYFKGGAEARLLQSIHDDGSVHLNALFSTPPTDFHPTKHTYVYFTKNKDVAEKYAGYCEERIPPVKAAVLCIAMPSALPNTTEIYGDDWRKLMWFSRNERVSTAAEWELPTSLRRYEEAGILIGNVCGDATKKIERMSDMSELTEMRRPTAGSSKAMQLVIQKKNVREAIGEQCRGFAWISSFARRRG